MKTQTSDVFATIPSKDYLSLFQEDQPKYKDVIHALEFTKKDVSKATGVPVASIRFDAKIPRKVSERIREWAILLNLVAQHFDGDSNKTISWFTIPNPLLGGITPRNMIRFGRYKKLYKFVFNAITENRR